MSHGSALDDLAAQWVAAPSPTRCAALADALAKRGEMREARRLVAEGLSRYPGFVPALLVSARIALASGDRAGLTDALEAALQADPEHPFTRELVEAHAPELVDRRAGGESVVYATEADIEEVATADVEASAAMVTESLAALYRRQGHLEAARQAYAELVARDPDNTDLAGRYLAVQEEIAATRPLPFDAREAGGVAVRDWLARLSNATPRSARPSAASYDAFFEAPPAPPSATADFDAFQRWLGELQR
jgi:tetratricopeptide (TPR) repeat protein